VTPVTAPRIPIALPSTGEEEWQALREPLLSGWLTQGPQVAAFEQAFAARHRVRHALAVSSCTTGLHVALAAAGIGPGDEVIVPAFTWVATANVVLYVGATPVLADVSREIFNLDLDDVSRRITAKTRAVIAVHLFGLCMDVPALRRVVPPGVLIVEDCACAAGADFEGIPAGGLGDIGVFSFHPRKSITTGEGGMVTTNDSTVAASVDRLRNHGASVPEEQRHSGPQAYLMPEFNLLGFNYRMTDLQGAVGLVQLSKLDRFVSERQRWAEYYRDALADLPWLRLPQFPTHGRHAWQAFVTFVDPKSAPMPRNALMARLQDEGISTRPGTHAVHMLGYYRERYGFQPADFPGAMACHDNTMAIPLHNRMEAADYDRVIQALRAI
jgi:perosamine synthetase